MSNQNQESPALELFAVILFIVLVLYIGSLL